MSDSTEHEPMGLNERMRKGQATVREIMDLLARFDPNASVLLNRTTLYVQQGERLHPLDQPPPATGYRKRTVSDLRYYAGKNGLGIRPSDVEHYLGRRVGIDKLNKRQLVELHTKLDRDGRGLGLTTAQ